MIKGKKILEIIKKQQKRRAEYPFEPAADAFKEEDKITFNQKEFLKFLGILLSPDCHFIEFQTILKHIKKVEILPVRQPRRFFRFGRTRVAPDSGQNPVVLPISLIERVLLKKESDVAEKLVLLKFLIANQNQIFGLQAPALEGLLSQIIEENFKSAKISDYLSNSRFYFNIVFICHDLQIPITQQFNVYALFFANEFTFNGYEKLLSKIFSVDNSLDASLAIGFLKQDFDSKSLESPDIMRYIKNLVGISYNQKTLSITKIKGGDNETLRFLYLLLDGIAKKKNEHDSFANYREILNFIDRFSSQEFKEEFLAQLKKPEVPKPDYLAIVMLEKVSLYFDVRHYNDFIFRSILILVKQTDTTLNQFLYNLTTYRPKAFYIEPSSELTEFLEGFEAKDLVDEAWAFAYGILPVESLALGEDFVNNFCQRYIKSPINLSYLSLLQKIVEHNAQFKKLALTNLKKALSGDSLEFWQDRCLASADGPFIAQNAEEVADVFACLKDESAELLNEKKFGLCMAQVVNLRCIRPEELKTIYSARNISLHISAARSSLDGFLNYLDLDFVDKAEFLSLVVDMQILNDEKLLFSRDFLKKLVLDEKFFPCRDVLAKSIGEDELFLILQQSKTFEKEDLDGFVKQRVSAGNIGAKQLEFLFTNGNLSAQERSYFVQIIAKKIDEATVSDGVGCFAQIRRGLSGVRDRRDHSQDWELLRVELLQALNPFTAAVFELMPQCFLAEAGSFRTSVESIEPKLQDLTDEELINILEICYLSTPKKFEELFLFTRSGLSFENLIQVLIKMEKTELLHNFVLEKLKKDPIVCKRFIKEAVHAGAQIDFLSQIFEKFEIDFLYNLYKEFLQDRSNKIIIGNALVARINDVVSYSSKDMETVAQVLSRIDLEAPALFLKIDLNVIINKAEVLEFPIISKLSSIARFMAVKSCQHPKLLEGVVESLKEFGLTHLLDQVRINVLLEEVAKIVEILQQNNCLKFDMIAEPELAAFLRQVKNDDKEAFASILQSLINANDDKSSAGSLLLRPEIKVDGVLCRKVKDVAFLAILLPEMLQPSHYKMLAKNPDFVTAVNASINYADSKYFSLASFLLFQKINRFVVVGQERINTAELLAFETIIAKKQALPRIECEIKPEIAALNCLKAIENKFGFHDFCRHITHQELQDLGLDGDNSEIQSNWSKLMANSDLIIEFAKYATDVKEFTSMLAAAMQLTTQPECAINLRTQLQGELETKRYTNLEDAAFAVICFYTSYQAFNSLGDDVIYAHRDYEVILRGDRAIYLSQRSFFKLIGEKYAEFLEKSGGDADFVVDGFPKDDDEVPDDYELVQAKRVENLIKKGSEIFERIATQGQEQQPRFSAAISGAAPIVGGVAQQVQQQL